MLQSSASTELPAFAEGSLPKQFADFVAPPVSETRRKMGEKDWHAKFVGNQALRLEMLGGKVMDFDSNTKGSRKPKAKPAAAGERKDVKKKEKKEVQSDRIEEPVEPALVAPKLRTKGALSSAPLETTLLLGIALSLFLRTCVSPSSSRQTRSQDEY